MVKKNSSLIIVTKIPRVNETIFIIEKFGVLFLVIYIACIIRKALEFRHTIESGINATYVYAY